MKSIQALDYIRPNTPSHLGHIRGQSNKFDDAKISKDFAGDNVSHEQLQEMEGRVKSRLELYEDDHLTDKLSESLHSFSFKAPISSNLRSSLNQTPNGLSMNNQSLNASWQFYKFVGVDENNDVAYSSANRKPSEAIFTIDAKTSKILVANRTACGLFRYKEEELCGGMKISQLFTMEDGIKHEILMEQNIENNGNIVMASGKILEAIDADKNSFVVSVWMKRILAGKNPRCVVVLEPVEVTKSSFIFDSEGIIKDCDFPFAFIHGYEDVQEVVNMSLFHLLPAFVLPQPGKEIEKDTKKQRLTSRTKDMLPFPATIKLKEHRSTNNEPSEYLYKGFMWVFANISGLITVKSDGSIECCNSNFVRMFFGYTENDLIGKNITKLIPYFYEQIDLLCDETRRIKGKHSPRGKVNLKKKKDHTASTTEAKPADPDATLSDNEEKSLDSISTVEDCDTIKVNNAVKVEDATKENIDTKEINGIKETNAIKEKEFKIGQTVISDSKEKINLISHIEKNDSEYTSELTDNLIIKNSTPKTSNSSLSDSPSLQLSPEKHQLKFDSHLKSNEFASSSPLADKDTVDHFLNNLLTSSENSLNNHDNEKTCKTSGYNSAENSSSNDQKPLDSKNNISDITTPEHLSNSYTRLAKHFQSGNSTPIKSAWVSSSVSQEVVPGQYYGQAMHKDTSLLPIVFEIKHISSRQHEDYFCIWISRDPDEEGGCHSRQIDILGASYNSTINTSANMQELMRSMKDITLEDPGRGPYNENYVNITTIGKGAFGFVNLAEKKSTKEKVIVKFIRKEKVLKGGWTQDDELGYVPFEVYLLSKLDHPNIVKMLEAYENDEFFQIIMEKHGEGIDLFEFIDRKPCMDEALASYMFRQVLEATEYLHKQNILHRDIKDENIIVDRLFTMKLIDFGSAAYMKTGKLFNTFCGTVEYCSPEVLLGNWYEGPELEMWSLGVTLYTFIFGEHPFFEVEEAIRAELFPPFNVSNELMFVLCWMLHPEVEFRAKLKDVISYPWFTRHVDITNYDYDTVLGGLDNQGVENDNKTDQVVGHTSPDKNSDIYSTCSSSESSYTDLSSSISSGISVEENKELRKEYYKYLTDKCDSKSNAILSKSL